MKGSRIRLILLSGAAGAALATVCDPQSGHRRRALVADKLTHYAHVLPRRARGSVRGVGGPLRGLAHAMRRRLPGARAPALPDDDTFIKQRVESVLGHDTDLSLDTVTFEAVGGVVRIRGTAPDASMVGRLVERVATVDGVRAVESLMRTPDGFPLAWIAGDDELITGPVRSVVLGEALTERMLAQWPGLAEADILASEGYLGRLVARIQQVTGQPAADIRSELDELLGAVV